MGQDLAWKQGTITLLFGPQIPVMLLEFDTFSPRRAEKYQVLRPMSTKKNCLKKILPFSMDELGLRASSPLAPPADRSGEKSVPPPVFLMIEG